MNKKLCLFSLLLPATCFLLTAPAVHGVLINWGAGVNPIFNVDGAPLADGSFVQLIWDRDLDGIDPPDSDGLPADGDELLSSSFIGHGSFFPGTFSENTETGDVTVGSVVYVRAWNGETPGEATYYGDTQGHTPSLWTIDSDLDYTLDATFNSSWGMQTGWTGVEESNLFTHTYAYALFQNYPNPFGRTTKILFTVPGTLTYRLGENGERKTVSAEKKKVSIRVYDVAGRLVKRLVDERKDPGVYRIEWKGRDHGERTVASGVYFYSLVVGKETSVRKMVLMK